MVYTCKTNLQSSTTSHAVTLTHASMNFCSMLQMSPKGMRLCSLRTATTQVSFKFCHFHTPTMFIWLAHAYLILQVIMP
jgi:hypothetical protein